jgi:hypothetical protein
MTKILVVGEDERLLESRSAVLRRTGATVVSHLGGDVQKLVLSELPDLVVLCHSLGADEAELVADGVRECCPATRILLVSSGLGSDRPYKESKFDSISLPEPSQLLKRVVELLLIPPAHSTEKTPNVRPVISTL